MYCGAACLINKGFFCQYVCMKAFAVRPPNNGNACFPSAALRERARSFGDGDEDVVGSGGDCVFGSEVAGGVDFDAARRLVATGVVDGGTDVLESFIAASNGKREVGSVCRDT